MRAASAPSASLLHISIARYFHACAGMGHGTGPRRPNLVRILPQIPALERDRPRLPRLRTLFQLSLVKLDIERALLGVEHDHVPVADERDGAADGSLRPDMADAKAARGAREAAIGDERHLVAHALAVDRRRGRQHLAHAGAAPRSLIADDDHVAFLVALGAYRGEGVLLAVEAAGGTPEFQPLHAGDLDDGAIGSERAAQADDATRGQDWLIGRAD